MDDEWCRRLEARRAQLLSCAEMLESGVIGSHEMVGGQQIDTSAEWASRFREYVAELDELLSRTG